MKSPLSLHLVHKTASAASRKRLLVGNLWFTSVFVCMCLLLQYLLHSCSRGGRGIGEDMCCEMCLY